MTEELLKSCLLIELCVDNAVDFNVVNFSNAVDHFLMYQVCEHFDLHKYTCHELWKMEAQVTICNRQQVTLFNTFSLFRMLCSLY